MMMEEVLMEAMAVRCCCGVAFAAWIFVGIVGTCPVHDHLVDFVVVVTG